MQVSSDKIKNYAVIAVIVIIGILFVVVNKSEIKDNDALSSSDQLTEEQATDAASLELPSDSAAENAANAFRENPRATSDISQAAKNIVRMQELMDEEENHPQALALAQKLIVSGGDEERAAALDAFQWIGGKESVKSLTGVLNERTAIGDRAKQVLEHLIQENLFSAQQIFDIPMWQDIFNSLPDESAILSYMILLSAYPTAESVPVLLELMKSDKQVLVEQARSMMESIANGEEFATREDAQAWFERYLQDHQDEIAAEARQSAAEQDESLNE